MMLYAASMIILLYSAPDIYPIPNRGVKILGTYPIPILLNNQ